MLNDGFYSISQYVECGKTISERIMKIDFIIAAMELKMLDMVEGSVYDEYQLDDGQMKVRTKYRSTSDFIKGLDVLEKMKSRLIQKLNGRTVVLRSGMF